MATYCLPGRLNTLVETYKIQTTIMSWLATDGKLTSQEIYQKIQSDEGLDAYVKGHSMLEIKTVLEWMEKNGMIVNAAGNQQITYVPVEGVE